MHFKTYRCNELEVRTRSSARCCCDIKSFLTSPFIEQFTQNWTFQQITLYCHWDFTVKKMHGGFYYKTFLYIVKLTVFAVHL